MSPLYGYCPGEVIQALNARLFLLGPGWLDNQHLRTECSALERCGVCCLKAVSC